MTLLRKTGKRAAVSLLLALTAGLVVLHALDWAYPFPAERIDDRLAAGNFMIRAKDRSLIAWPIDREENRRLPVKLEAVSQWLVEATIAVEDKRFRSHVGVDPVAVARAAGQNIAQFRRVSGASTITMQTIRLLWQRPRRLDSKIIEAFRAWQLERLVGKDRILEIYLNLAPYGGNLIGAEAASRRYFGKSAKQLTLAEACLLAGLPQSPSRLNPLVNPDAARARRDFVVQRLLEDGRIDAAQAEAARRQALELSRNRDRIEAPHFAQFVYARATAGPGVPAAIDTTLDPDIQATAARLAKRRAETLAETGVSGPAVVVLSVADSSILAHVGNASPKGAPARLVDGARARRQPGSLMKPFIFALLAEKGAVSPSTRVYDAPRTWADYAPRNMDREWRGAMAAGDALRQSRNITAVAQLEKLGVDAFGAFMQQIGLDAGAGGQYGLSLALGAKEQTLFNLANAYAALGRLGAWLPLRFNASSPAGRPSRVLSPGSAWLALSALSHPAESATPRVVWKTGTSWNQLDAWAVAMTPELAVGVWCGRLGRGGSQWVAGGEDALPLALDILESVSGRPGAAWPRPPEVEMRPVCAESGDAPGWDCAETALSPVLANRRQAACRLHAGLSATSVEMGVRTEDVSVKASPPLRIVSPTSGATYVDLPGMDATLPLLAEGGRGGELVWFVDGRVHGAGRRGAPLDWRLSPGSHRVSVTDAEGGTAEAVVSVVRK